MPQTEKTVDPKRGWYRQIGVSQSTFAKLEALRARKAKLLGIEPSWNEFLQLLLPAIEKAVEAK